MHHLWEDKNCGDRNFRNHLISALSRSRVSVMVQRRDGRYLSIINLPRCWNEPKDGQVDDVSLFGDAVARRIGKLKQPVLEAGKTVTAEIETGDHRIFEFTFDPVDQGTDREVLVTTIVELTEERQRENALRSLLREVSHRSKNLLAIIQSIANHSAKGATSIDHFLRDFRGRLHAMAKAQDLITDTNWRGARFRDLALDQVQKYLPEPEETFELTGANPLLTPNETVHVGLALHELVVSAVSARGALDHRSRIKVGCTLDNSDGRPMVTIQWLETSDCAVPAPNGNSDQGFGGMVLSRVAPAAVNGTSRYTVSGNTVSYELVFPAELASQE